MTAPTPVTLLQLPAPAPLFSGKGWTAYIAALIAVCALAPLLNLWVPEGSVFHLSDYAVGLVGKIMCYAIVALAMDLIWGYTGILSLGHGVFFALGGYVMGMYLMRQIGRDGNYKSDLPDFMVFLDWKELPWHWALSDSFVATLILVVAVPGCHCVCVWLLRLPLAHQGRVLLHHHPGHDLSRPCCCSSATKPVLAATTASPISSAYSAWRLPRRVCAWRFLCSLA